jgi:hypothetical protein
MAAEGQNGRNRDNQWGEQSGKLANVGKVILVDLLGFGGSLKSVSERYGFG